MNSVPRFNTARHLLARAAQSLAIIRFSAVMAQSVTAQNYIVGILGKAPGTPDVSHLTHLNYAFASIILNSGSYYLQVVESDSKLIARVRAFKLAIRN